MFIPGYDKFSVPSPLGNDSTLIVNVSIIIDNIISINENDGIFKSTITLVRSWFDQFLIFQNLQRDMKNKLSSKEMEEIWKPFTVSTNIEHVGDVKKTEAPDIMLIIPNKNFHFVKDDRTNFRNTRLFRGAENAFHYERQLTINSIFVADMRWYPFDTQRCTLQMVSSESLVSFNPLFVNYSGPVVLPQHFVKGVNICPFLDKGKSGLIVEVFLGRPLFGTVLSVFMPTSVFLVLSHMVKIFGKDHLEMVIEVNLTLLLVLATL